MKGGDQMPRWNVCHLWAPRPPHRKSGALTSFILQLRSLSLDLRWVVFLWF